MTDSENHSAEGFRIARKASEWMAVLAFGSRRFGGLAPTKEAAVLALLEQLLVAFDAMIAKAVRYRVVEVAVTTHVHELTARFIQELRKVYNTSLSEQESAVLWDSFDLQVDVSDEDQDLL